ncbi:MAG: hypothetical protein ACI9K3_001513, partial [Halovenus sp.]
LAEQRGVDVETVLAEADLPPEPGTDLAAESEETATEQATSRPSADTSSE